MVTVQFEVPAYGSIGNATKKFVLMSGMGLNTEDEAMFVPDNFTFAIKAYYQYIEDGETYD